MTYAINRMLEPPETQPKQPRAPDHKNMEVKRPDKGLPENQMETNIKEV